MRNSMLGGLGFIGAVVLACGGSDNNNPVQCSGASCADGGPVEAGDQDVVVPTSCDLTKDISDSPACVDDGIGVFVNATAGSDSNLGTKAMPFKTIGYAIQKAGAKPRVYICEGTYPSAWTRRTAPAARAALAGSSPRTDRMARRA